MVFDRPPALVFGARNLLRPVPVGVAVGEDVGRAPIVAEGALVVDVLTWELRIRGDAADVAGRARLVVNGVPPVEAHSDTADRVLDEDALCRRLDRGVGNAIVIAGGRMHALRG